jgi:hypothetical protein
MKSHHQTNFCLSILLLLSILLFGKISGYAEDQKYGDSQPPGTYIELTESFYRALQNEQSGGERIYGNTGKSDEYLRQIAISTKFMVETNIQIIKQQEKIIELLGATGGKRGK